jgi:hypothetical protein
MPLRSVAQTLADLRVIVEKLAEDQHSYDAEALVALRRILYKRIAELTGELLSPTSSQDDRPAEVCVKDS